ncbi:MAG TPA: cupredoxin domain-containing protein [Candidatus Binatia bacterium]|nr:cupredoxin domain-containing protein [Candidatus Binatia bacterium]
MAIRSLGLAAALAAAVASAAPREQVIHVTAQRFRYEPNVITLRKGVPVVLELVSLDREHGFKVRGLGLRADIKPGAPTRLRFVPQRTGRFPFACDVFCGSKHEEMTGELVVVD